MVREHLRAAKVDRPQLYERSKERNPINMHGLRPTFVTLALAAGRNESWVRARTGHRSSHMIACYEATKLLAEKLDLGWLQPMHEAIPKLLNWRRGLSPITRRTQKAKQY